VPICTLPFAHSGGLATVFEIARFQRSSDTSSRTRIAPMICFIGPVTSPVLVHAGVDLPVTAA
jgi:hypothetical protein